jgi:hypothetical protein
MAEVNEEILEQYLKVVKKWFYVVDISFVVPHNYSNIDVLGYDPMNNEFYDFEVKYRSAASLPNNQASIDWMVSQFCEHKEAREKKLKEFTGNKKSIKVLVTTKQMMGKSENKRSSLESAFFAKMKNNRYKAAVWYFDEMIPELVSRVSLKGKYNTQLLQTIRMLRVYKQA